MSFCWDVYVWLPRRDPELLRAFVDRYVDPEAPGDDRLPAFRRTYITGTPGGADAAALAELHPSDGTGAFTLYLHGRNHPWAMITMTEDDAAVLGLSIDDPGNSPAERREARELIERLRQEFAAPAGIAGVEMPPPGSRHQWRTDHTPIRVGTIPDDPA
ncbi:hypothetical protein [Actinoplanes auranticolor]|uniref:Uncharacterized protein n=1 Tax=Actinoplanes auranticolor TaxID=47988 RepID=A0A919S8F2_9ACTN|nr:hypothetical protein [Actinoplanes auranticolor]GIM67664.1 hypothetical protein Aau02nite_28290 [Actinoplanes auranticolor]